MIPDHYAVLGVEHILGGFDHLLFVFGLLLLVRHWRPLVATITAFTVGHSITLALAVLGIATVPSGPVEVLIALSVFVLAVELARLDTRFIPTEHVALDALFADHLASAKGSRQARRRRRTRALQRLMADLYPRAQAVVAVSAGVADDVANHTGLARERVRVIHNPVVDADLVEAAREPPPPPWFSDDGGHITSHMYFMTTFVIIKALSLLLR